MIEALTNIRNQIRTVSFVIHIPASALAFSSGLHAAQTGYTGFDNAYLQWRPAYRENDSSRPPHAATTTWLATKTLGIS